ncbi:CO/xanthine dehydrogenase FAD-binding subunit [Streptomyces achromogenes]|uniref:CO/xanthine dehydrogenase FAD-binding subunit n=1 Tax=Streptomyces achromogenes TaxID=67255 RepID=A0ABU0QC26_STRAH|nr:FAD binding domain-containing protein [Streptomyces achromogenes]MDQ0688221.1 CO/xanthine dehydrogenase FAD-binding subunit [Streptomyces achromogenes]MDQ0835417.1 CO/xanthine dehydrogenase FAD-binding subunit [Streptomyces achromogenes]
MQLRLPSSISEAQRCLAEGAVPVGGATLVWAGWQRDGFPEQAVSLRRLPEANAIGPGELGGAVLLHHVDATVPEVLHRAAGGVGTGAVRRAATVGGNIVGSTLRCLLPAALVLDARATVLTADGVYETDLAELLAKRLVLLALRWRTPLASGYRKLEGAAGGAPPLVVAVALHSGDEGRAHLRVAVRDNYDVLSGSAPCEPGAGAGEVLHALEGTELGELPAAARDAVRDQVVEVLARAAG